MDFKRSLDLQKGVLKKSLFLFGPRSTGKTHLVRHQFPSAHFIDLLDLDLFTRLLQRPQRLEEEVPKTSDIVVIDEIQKIPILLDIVHRLIEMRGTKFVLTGSSARKLKHGGANLLGGRASWKELFPLTSAEIPDFQLLQYLRTGGIPRHYLSSDPRDDIRDYTQLYLKEEIVAESIVRRVDHFARFMEVMGLHSGEELNYQNIANDSQVPPRTVSNFVEILTDTLLAFEVPPFTKSKKRKAVSRSKIYFFDVGVANFLSGRVIESLKSDAAGKAFEHFIAQELRAYLSYTKQDLPLQYWRTTTQLEVDFVLGDQLAIEVKSTNQVNSNSLKALKALQEEKLVKKQIVISQEPVRRTIEKIEIWPWAEFLKALWEGDFI